MQLHDGRVLVGLVVEQTEQALVLKDAKNQTVRLPRDEIEQLTTQTQSLMPDQQLRDMTAQQAADLLAYLSTLRAETGANRPAAE